jgi:hypothetical protein
MAVTIPVLLTSEEQTALQAQAQAQGVSVDSLLRKAVLQIIARAPDAPPPQRELSGEELEKAFEEIADLIPDNVPPNPDEALSRESIYTREDEW